MNQESRNSGKSWLHEFESLALLRSRLKFPHLELACFPPHSLGATHRAFSFYLGNSISSIPAFLISYFPN
jgi:hypothetical protein